MNENTNQSDPAFPLKLRLFVGVNGADDLAFVRFFRYLRLKMRLAVPMRMCPVLARVTNRKTTMPQCSIRGELMRILAVSDIHGNIEAVREVRARERNVFDIVLVPGDIVSTKEPVEAGQIFDILESFECPVLYVYGNADHRLSYDDLFGRNSVHLHLRSVESGGITFIGMSGCTENWGRNPIAEGLVARIAAKHRCVLVACEEAAAALAAAKLEIERTHEADVERLGRRTRDRRRREYWDKVRGLEAKRDRKLEKAALPLERIQNSKEYVRYSRDRLAANKEAEILNRRALVDLIRKSGIAPDRTVLLAHKRLYRLHEDVPGVLLHIFGHKHRFTDTTHRGSRFVTVGALTQPISVVPDTDEDESWHNVRNVNDGNYVSLEIGTSGRIKVAPVPFAPSFRGWRRLQDLYSGTSVPWVPFRLTACAD